MKIPVYQIDAFTGRVFSGNPAAVCPLEEWLDDAVLQAIASENNLSETAFFVKSSNGYDIRWFTPVSEVDLCGHATLASAFVIFEYLGSQDNELTFNSRSGELKAKRENDIISMEFPSQPPHPCTAPPLLIEGLKKTPIAVLKSQDYFVVFETEEDIRDLNPEWEKFKALDLRGVIATAEGDEADFVSRFFAPKFGIHEDPVTGSAHCALVPYWSKKLRKDQLYARQLSKRGGELFLENRRKSVIIKGRAVMFMKGFIHI